jgi:hypothetical protein
VFSTAFQQNAFQNDAFQIVSTPIIIIDDTHDGDYLRKKFLDDQEAQSRRRKAVIDTYEMLVEGRPAVAAEIVAPYVMEAVSEAKTAPIVDFSRLLDDTDRLQRLLDAYIEMDDEEVLLLI